MRPSCVSCTARNHAPRLPRTDRTYRSSSTRTSQMVTGDRIFASRPRTSIWTSSAPPIRFSSSLCQPAITQPPLRALDRGRSGIFGLGDVVTPGRVVALLVDVKHRDVGHEPGRRGPVPVMLSRLEEHAVSGPYHLDRP